MAAWIESQADERGVSKAKVIRDAVETAQATGLVQAADAAPAEKSDILTRVQELESRVDALEDETGLADQASAHDTESLVSAFEAQLDGQPPTTSHGEQAVTRVFEMLLEGGPMQANELREALYPEFDAEFSTPKSMWQSINRYLSDIDGITQVGHGKWDVDTSRLMSR